MGAYDIIGKTNIQIKLDTPCIGLVYNIGDEIPIPDGLYIGYEGYFIVENSIIIYEGKEIFNKWGESLNFRDILDPGNHVCKCIDKIDKIDKKSCCSHKNIDILLLNNLI